MYNSRFFSYIPLLTRYLFYVCLSGIGLFHYTVATAAKTQIVSVDHKEFRAIEVNPKQVALYWKNADGKAFSRFSGLKRVLTKQGKSVSVMMNAGIYSTSDEPAGLHVENGNIIHALNTRTGKGNFHLQPNGVFLINNHSKAEIITTKNYQHHYSGREKYLQLATQSGPMLLINGKINHKFLPTSSSEYTRNGVCTTPQGRLYFFTTNNSPSVTSNFYQFARAAQKIGCDNALYLDGSISKLYIAGENSIHHFPHYVGILTVTTP